MNPTFDSSVRGLIRLLSPVFVALLAGCATVGPKPLQNSAYPESALPAQWQLEGKLASTGLGAANFTWQQQGSDLFIAIHAPLGAGAARIRLVDGKLAVSSGDGDYGDQAAREWLALNGLAVPYQALPYWVQGLPHPDLSITPVATKTSYVKSFEQAGWQITVKRRRAVACVNLPERMEIRRAEVRLKFGGMRWQWQRPAERGGPQLFSKPQVAAACAHD